jgi:hypothetical protein
MEMDGIVGILSDGISGMLTEGIDGMEGMEGAMSAAFFFSVSYVDGAASSQCDGVDAIRASAANGNIRIRPGVMVSDLMD